MAGRTSTQSRHYPRGVSRIFQQSVKDLRHKEIHTATENNGKPDYLGGFGKPTKENRADSNKVIGCSKNENEDIKTPVKKSSDVQVKVSNKGKHPCLLSLELKEKQSVKISGISHRASSFRTTVRGRGRRYENEINWARQNKELNRIRNEQSSPQTTINHFNEDWLTDTEDPLIAEAPDFGPLQSTPKRQLKKTETNNTKLSVDSEPDKYLMVGGEKAVTNKNANNSIQSVNHNYNGVENKDYKNQNVECPEENDNVELGQGVVTAEDKNKYSKELSTACISETDSAVISFCIAEPNDKGDAHTTDSNQDFERLQSHMPKTGSVSSSKDFKSVCKVNNLQNKDDNGTKKVIQVNNQFEKYGATYVINDMPYNNEKTISSVVTLQSRNKTSPDSEIDMSCKKNYPDRFSRASPNLRPEIPPRFKKRAHNEMNRDLPHQNDKFYGNRRTSDVPQKTSGGFVGSPPHIASRFESWDQQCSIQSSHFSHNKDRETRTRHPSNKVGSHTNQNGTEYDNKEINEWMVPSSEDWSMEIRDEALEPAEIQGEKTSTHQDMKDKNTPDIKAQDPGRDMNQNKMKSKISDQNNNIDSKQSGSGCVDISSGCLEQDNINDENKCTGINDAETEKSNEMFTEPYLPPPPPSEELEAFEELVEVHDIQSQSDKENLETVVEDVHQVCEEINAKLKIIKNESKNIIDNVGVGNHEIANKDGVVVNGLGAVSSEGYVFELPLELDDIQDIKSTSSDYLVNLSEFDCPVVTKSQEGSLESVHGTVGVTNIRKLSDNQTYIQEDIHYYDDYTNWWNTQQNASYWNWYYYMYMESYRHTMNWQRGQNYHLVTDQRAEWDQQPNTGQNNAAHNNQFGDIKETIDCHNAENLQVMDNSLPADVVAERTNNWVNSHMPDPDARKQSTNIKTNMTLKNRKENVTYTRKANNGGDMNEEDEIRTINNDVNTGVQDSGVPACNCSARDVLFVTWRSCRCSPPAIHGIHSMGDLQSDLGYHSYESVLDQEDTSLPRKDSGSHDHSASPLNSLIKPGPMESKWNQKQPYLYEQIVGNRNMPQSQYVYMLHARASQNQGSAQSTVQPTDNESCSAVPKDTDKQDENGNKVQQGPKPQGLLKALVEDINKNYRQAHDDSSVFSPDSGQSGIREHFLSQRHQQSSERSQELTAPLVQSEAHLSQVNKTLSNAEKTNSQLGKSVGVMKDAIAAIKRYTDQLKGEMKGSETGEDINANVMVKSKESESETPSARNVKYGDSDIRDVQETSAGRGKENVMIRGRVKPFKIKKRENKSYGSSCEPQSDSSDEICKDSMLSQSPSTHIKFDTMIAPHALTTSYSDKMKGVKHGANSQAAGKLENAKHTGKQPKNVTKLSRTYRGRGTSPASARQGPSSFVDNPGKGNFSETSSVTSDHMIEPRTGYRSGIRQPLQPYQNPWFNPQNQISASSPFNARSATYQHKTPQKQIHSSEDTENPDRPNRRRKSLVQYTVSDDSSSEDEEIRPFDVDSLSSDFNQGSHENIHKSGKEKNRTKKLKHDTTSDDDSTSTPPIRKVIEKPKTEPVTFLQRPLRKLSHRQLKDLPSQDFPTVTFVKKGASKDKEETKSQAQYPKTMAEFIAMHQKRDSEDKAKASSDLTVSVKPPCGAIEGPSVPPLPPLPPFPQSQFWSMYLPKYNSALTGTQASTSITPNLKNLSTSPVTPEMKRPTMRRSWGGAGCAIVSPPGSDSESDKSPINEWRANFRRFNSFGVKYIDTHCHLDFLFKREGFCGNLKDYMGKNQDLFPEMFEGCVAVFCNPVTFNPRGGLWKEVAKEDNVWFAMGCHPKMATDFTEISEAGLRECLKHEKCVALGEIGLDYSGTFQQHEDVQKKVFRKQLTIALEMNKPLVIHCRDAEQDCLDILKEMVPKNYKIHCHCFTGYYYNAKLWMEAFPNLYIGVTPLVTYRTATPSHDLAKNIPLNRLLLETDAPYFVPQGVPKNWLMFSSPGLAVTVAKEIAQYQELPVAAVLRHCRLNTKSMYGI